MDNLVYWLWLSLSVTPGSRTFKQLLDKFSSPEEIFLADEASIASVISSKNSDYGSLINKDLSRAEEIYKFCKTKNVGILTYSDKNFPTALKNIKAPPVLLYYRGVLPRFNDEFCVSVVGTRTISEYGKKNAFEVSHDLSCAGALIVSGMAIGIDGVAHAGALAAGGKTVAIIGSGIDVCYPPQHKHLARAIVKCGCVMTEFPPSTPPNRYNFPIRNRIVSGLSCATLVIEGREKSGALITAMHAKEEGRRVFALPGNVGNQNSEVSNLLIRNGASLFTSANDVILALEKDCVGRLNPFKITGERPSLLDALTEYQVSAVSAGDPIFKAPRAKKMQNPSTQAEHKPPADEKILSTLNGKNLTLYNKIPQSSDIAVNDLIDEEHSLKDVMRGLLTLEMMQLVTMLPGDRVTKK